MLMFLLLACLWTPLFSLGFELGAKLKSDLTAPKVRIVLGLDGAVRYKHLDNLKSELQSLQQQWGNFTEHTDQKAAEIKQQIEDLNQTGKQSPALTRMISGLHKLEALTVEIKDTKIKTIELLQQHIDFWSSLISESSPQNGSYEEKSLYSFADFQNITKKNISIQEQIHQVLSKKDEVVQEINRQESVVATKEKEFSTIEQIIEDKKRQTDMKKDDISMLDLDKEFIQKERDLALLRLSFYQKQLDFLSSKESILQDKLQELSEEATIVRNRLYVEGSEVQQYERKHIEQKKSSEQKHAELVKLRQEVAQKKIAAQDDFDRLKHRFKISLGTMQQFLDFDRDVQTISDRFALYSVGHALSSMVKLDGQLQNIKIMLLVQDAQDRQTYIALQAIKLLYEIVHGHSKDSETFEKERADYKKMKSVLQQEMKQHKEFIATLHKMLKDTQHALEYLKQQQEVLRSGNHVMYSSTQKKWTDSLMLLEQIIQDLQQEQEIILHINDHYESLLRIDEQTLELIITLLQEFDMIGVWHRSMSAVTWDGIKNIVPNLTLFLKDVYIIITTYISQLTIQKIAYGFAGFGFGGMLALFLMMFGLFLAYLFLQALLPSFYRSLISDQHDDTDPLYRWRHLFAIVIGFGGDVFKPLYVWCLCLMYEFLYDVPVALVIVFYIYSITFWIYASRRLLVHILTLNRKFDYFLLSKRLIDRFSLVYSFFSIATILILIMRRMFIVVMAHQQTELPNILLRVYHVVIFISIIFSLDKDEIMQWLPKKSVFWQRFAQLFNNHYYLFLLSVFSVLIMSDPYLGGYGSLLWYVFWNLFLTIIIGVVLFLVYNIIKQYTAILFFEEDGVGVQSERFEHAKTWYVITIVMSMLMSMMVGIIVCSYVWGYGFTYVTLRKIVLHEIFKIESINSAGKIIPESFKVINLLYIIFMTMCGIIAAYLFRRVVLQRLFDIQYVDPGIQNTIIIISRYVIITFAIMIACVQSKLGSLVTGASYVALVVVGWSFKDLFTDFVAYFFILVQRPVKLGDYVKIDSETMGVVRRVGPRAVILRRKNAVNIIVPNSTILKSSLYNWNYTRSYIGLEDIVFTVPFGTDIKLVRKLCFKALDEDSDVLKVPQPFVRLQDFDDKGYVFLVRGFLSSGNTLRQWDIASNVRFALVEKLQEAGITIAGPSIRIVLKDGLHTLDQSQTRL
ncbi:mechanosensitive ion channel [Candidatus Babeliales bacterium]|nr:mechanosensitive ion channel [Candidatus Babeliales bacterium]